ncbi:hypothetical protein PIB30_111365, partial [Stylosanthes scabra]|nr:hypothetical protein [Stylosanthes scabra]
MPKKAIVASSRGKGIRLALPGPIKQSQSSHESGSSTQQSGSSTQQPQSTQKPGSSTQQPPSQSSQQAKQTKADQGITKVNKKSWAEICSESEDEIDLTQLIAQTAKQKTIVSSPQEKPI